PPPMPTETATYCTPSCSQVIGWPSMPEPVLNCHSLLPVSASNASNSPVSLPVNTRPHAGEARNVARLLPFGLARHRVDRLEIAARPVRPHPVDIGAPVGQPGAEL